MSLALAPFPEQGSTSFKAPAFLNGREAPIWELGIVTVWFLAIFAEFPGAGPLRYLCTAYFFAIMLIHYKDFVPLALKALPILLLPVLSFMSFTWSDYPSEAMRQGIFYILTAIIVLVIAMRVKPEQSLRCIAIAGMLIVLYKLGLDGGIAGDGPYMHKNFLALHVLITYLACLTILLDATESALLRFATLPFILVCPLIIMGSGSATSLVMLVVATPALLAVRYLLVDLGRIAFMRTLIFSSGLLVVLLVALALLNADQGALWAHFLEATGREGNLSGRDALWNAADEISRENPIFGVGVGGFWQYDVGIAQTLVENDHKTPGTALGFHSSYYEVRVHLGFVGLTMFLVALGWTLFGAIRRVIHQTSLNAAAFMIFAGVAMIVSFTESWMWSYFNVIVNIFYLAGLATMGAGARKYLGEASVTVTNREDVPASA